MLYCERLKMLRLRAGLTQKEIANIIDVGIQGYNHFEKEYTIIPIKHLNTLCNFYNVSLDYIFNFTETKNYNHNSKEIINKNSGLKLKEFRKENKLTQTKLAEILNSSNSTISDYEIGKQIIATPFLYTICKKYNISADYLLGKIDEPKYLS